MTSDIVKRLRLQSETSLMRLPLDHAYVSHNDAADSIEQLEKALDALLIEAEDIFVCMADATGIDRHHHPIAFAIAHNALRGGKEDE